MKKQDKINLAKQCYDELTKLNVTITFGGIFAILNPPDKAPLDLIINLSKCSNEFYTLYAHSLVLSEV